MNCLFENYLGSGYSDVSAGVIRTRGVLLNKRTVYRAKEVLILET